MFIGGYRHAESKSGLNSMLTVLFHRCLAYSFSNHMTISPENILVLGKNKAVRFYGIYANYLLKVWCRPYENRRMISKVSILHKIF